MELTGWQQLWELYEHAGALPESEWQCYLERSTTDPNLRLRVLGMLRDPNSSMSEQPRALEPETGLDRTGTVVGRYRVERRIGNLVSHGDLDFGYWIL